MAELVCSLKERHFTRTPTRALNPTASSCYNGAMRREPWVCHFCRPNSAKLLSSFKRSRIVAQSQHSDASQDGLEEAAAKSFTEVLGACGFRAGACGSLFEVPGTLSGLESN